MKVGKSWGSVMAAVMVVLVVGVWEVKMGSAAPSAAACKEERRLGIDACKAVVYGFDPSPACCKRVKVTHFECICPVITPKLAALIDDEMAVRLFNGCGRIVPRHFKCGGIYIYIYIFTYVLISSHRYILVDLLLTKIINSLFLELLIYHCPNFFAAYTFP